MNRAGVLALDGAGLARALAAGNAIDPNALDGVRYRGISLGLPRLVEKLTWKTFAKAFRRDAGGRLRGWNVRLEQTGLDGPTVPLSEFGHFAVVPLGAAPRPCGPGLLLDYGDGSRGALARLRDPLVALEAGSADLLLGWSYLDLGFTKLPTPSYFLLEREAPI